MKSEKSNKLSFSHKNEKRKFNAYLDNGTSQTSVTYTLNTQKH